MRNLEALASHPFTTAQARSAGIGRGVLAGPRVTRLFDGVYVVGAAPSFADWVAGARLVLPPGSAATGTTAFRLPDLDLGPSFPLTFVTTHPHQVRHPRLRVIRVATPPRAVRGIADPASAFVVAAGQLDLVDLVSAGDWLVRHKHATLERLGGFTAAYRGRGARPARRAAGLIRRKVDSVRETRLRLCLVLAGLPEPAVNVTIGDERGPVGAPDLLLREWKIVLEYEGDQHRLDRRQWNLDIERSDGFAAAGYQLIRVTSAHFRLPRQLVQRVHLALVSRGYTGPAPDFSAEWSRLFEPTAR